MKNISGATWLCSALLASTFVTAAAMAADPAPGIVGKNEWLFYRYEISTAADATATDASLDLIRRFNKVLAANGIDMALVMVPLKMRIYAEHLPDSVKVNDYMRGNYDRVNKALRAVQVNTIDLNAAFLKSPVRASDTPLFFRLDTHWAPPGAMLAAETIKASLDANPALKKILDAMPQEGFKLVPGSRRLNSKARDLVGQLPTGSPTFGAEQALSFTVTRAQPAKEDLLGNRVAPPITLLGSSYSKDWTGFPAALRYTLQRDLLDISVSADQGSWVGMESYLRDDAFQTKPPKLLLWEMPERDLRAAPDYRYRDARYISDNTEWLMRASAWVQVSCKVSEVTANIGTTGLAATAGALKGGAFAGGATNDGDFIDISFDKPIGNLDYLSVRATTAGSKSMILEASGPGATTRRFTLAVAGDDTAHALKSPLPSAGKGYTKVRFYPGKSNKFALSDLQVCRQPEDLLK